jgi:hypothetical protein
MIRPASWGDAPKHSEAAAGNLMVTRQARNVCTCQKGQKAALVGREHLVDRASLRFGWLERLRINDPCDQWMCSSRLLGQK